ncbi:hypothetical protein BpHYR1_047897 [Brachionus plicatilis]|uniref:EGF-like domain-containing protein n=1 Tax=Brachionus plicatilis TaxID=10195 RepID=A0A3M7PGV9_BRAPC|nr:hypothetical protein BpHYR1_047897 [Brachionus plicatilis]
MKNHYVDMTKIMKKCYNGGTLHLFREKINCLCPKEFTGQFCEYSISNNKTITKEKRPAIINPINLSKDTNQIIVNTHSLNCQIQFGNQGLIDSIKFIMTLIKVFEKKCILIFIALNL